MLLTLLLFHMCANQKMHYILLYSMNLKNVIFECTCTSLYITKVFLIIFSLLLYKHNVLLMYIFLFEFDINYTNFTISNNIFLWGYAVSISENAVMSQALTHFEEHH